MKGFLILIDLYEIIISVSHNVPENTKILLIRNNLYKNQAPLVKQYFSAGDTRYGLMCLIKNNEYSM